MSELRRKRRRDIGRQRWQFVAVLVTVVLGVAMFAGMFNAYLNLGASLDGSYERLNMADMTVSDADAGFFETVLAIDGVSDAMERRQADVPFEIGDFSLVGRVVGMPPDAQPSINKVDVSDGSYLDPDDPSGVLLEEHAAENFDLEVGDTLVVAGSEVTVIGIVVSPEYLWPARDRQNAFTPPNTFAVVFAHESIVESVPRPIAVDQVHVLYEADVVTEDVDDDVRRAAEQANAADIQTLANQPSNFIIQEEIGGLQTMAVALPLLFLTAAGMAIYVLITRLVYSQRGVIGTLRATGFSSRRMSSHYRSYGVGVGLVGAAIGAVLGGLMARGMTAIYTAVFGIPDLVAEFHLPTVLLALAFGAIAGALAAIAPARIVAALPPAEAMRGDTPPAGGKRSVFETVVPPLRNAPVRWRMTLRGIGRNKKRSTSMVLGVVLGMVLVMAAWGMLDTMVQALDDQFNEISVEDAQIIFSVPVGQDQIDEIEDVIGVEHAEPVIGTQVTFRKGQESLTTILEGYERGTRVHGFTEPLPGSGVLLGHAMADILGLEVGDEVTIDFTSLETDLVTTVAGFVDEPLTTAGYMESSALVNELNQANGDITEETLSQPSFTTVKALFDETSNPPVVVELIRDLDDVAAAIDSTEIRDLVEAAQQFFFVFVGISMVFGGAMAFALIFNIISVNVAERAGEFASMRANGLTHRRVANLITGETFLLTLIGVIPGLFAGYWAAVALTNSFASEQFPLVVNIKAITFVGAAVAMFVVAALSLVPAIRAVRRINVGEVVRERAV